MERSSLDIGDYLDVLRRRKAQLFIPMLVVFLIATAIAFGLPAVYRSTATVLIEQQDIPQDLVRSTVTGYATERIQVISQRVMTRDNLRNIIEKYDLYPGEQSSNGLEEKVDILRDNVGVQMVSADVVDPRSGRAGKATIAFDLSFESGDPDAAKLVVDEMVSLYLEENARIRSQMAAETSAFLAEEANRLSVHIAELEALLAAYKEKNSGQLPELIQLNMNLMERAERELEDVQRGISDLEERKVYLESQLSQLEPNTGESPEGRLRTLQMAYLKASSVYSPDHPDIVSMRREIEGLKAQTGQLDNTNSLEQQILGVQSELAAAREKYSEDYPDVVALKRSLATLNDDLNKARRNSSDVVTSDFQPDNPAYVATKTQLESLKINLGSTLQRRDRLKAKLAEYENRIVQTPRVEQEGLSIQREYDNAVRKYHELKQNLLQAQVSEQLESENRGERFSLIQPAYTPAAPDRPNRPGILLLGAMLAMVSGLGFAAMSEYLDQSVRGSRGVSALLGSPPIATIPYFKTEAEEGNPQHRLVLIGAVTITVMILGVWILKALLASGG
ncbi:MAG: lipopolysaccharide biosynthesis protein [Gammaproteobacteria bacterium]|nr:lipopolysaccharide biosynthesis protein [Gammaproteobacteria bacterium]